MELFALATRHRAWLTSRQTAVAENIANVNTPGYKTRSVKPFDEILATQSGIGAMAVSHALHMRPAMGGQTVQPIQTSPDDDAVGATTHSGNSVTLEEQLLNAAAVNREYSMNTSISKAFSRMLTASLRG